MKATFAQVRDHLATLDLSDGGECLKRLVTNFMAELALPNEQRVHALKTYANLLQTLMQLGSNGDEAPVKRHASRREMRVRRLFSLELLDLATRFSVDLDRVEVNLLSHTQTATPQEPGMVGVRGWTDG